MDEIKKLRQSRRNLDAVKWMVEDDSTLPFWIADMDFKSPDFIEQEFVKRAQANYFGYTEISQSVKPGISAWFKERHNLDLNPENIILANGLKASYAAVAGRFIKQNDAAIVMTPLYPPLTKIIKDLGHEVYESRLLCNENRYEIDFTNLKEQIKNHSDISTLIICNPHNPVGRAWTKDELVQLANIAQENNLLVIADEIHADLTFIKEKFHTFCEAAEEIGFANYFVLGSPAKVFNVAGLKASYVISSNEKLLQELDKYQEIYGINQLSLFAITLLEAVYTNLDQAQVWLDQVLEILQDNYNLIAEKLTNNSKFELTKADATYLAWIKVNDASCGDSTEVKDVLKNKFEIDVNDGLAYAGDGATYIRFNFACPKKMLEVGIDQLIKAAETGEI